MLNQGILPFGMETVTIDSFDYREDQHFALLDDEKGVSLERLNPFSITQEDGNWHSAASTVGFATPGLENSQFIQDNNIIDEILFIPEKTISPDGDGFQDLLIIQYETDQPGYLLNAKIFDLQGREISYFIQNELLSNKGTFSWEGTSDGQEKARLGIYVLWFELFDLNGQVTTKKMPIIVAGQLD